MDDEDCLIECVWGDYGDDDEEEWAPDCNYCAWDDSECWEECVIYN